MEIAGNVLFIGEQKDVSTTDKPFLVRSFAVHTSSENNGMIYENTVGFQASGVLCDKLDQFNIGDEIKVTFGVSGTVKSKKDTIAPSPKNPDSLDCFTNLRVGRIDLIAAAGTPPAPAPNQAPPSSRPAPAPTTASNEGAVDLPF